MTIVNKYNYSWQGAAAISHGSPKSGSEELLQPLRSLSNICSEMLFTVITMKAVIPAQNASWARKEPKVLVLSTVPDLAVS